nr:hypothetical protein [Ophiocordyceps sp.]
MYLFNLYMPVEQLFFAITILSAATYGTFLNSIHINTCNIIRGLRSRPRRQLKKIPESIAYGTNFVCFAADPASCKLKFSTSSSLFFAATQHKRSRRSGGGRGPGPGRWKKILIKFLIYLLTLIITLPIMFFVRKYISENYNIDFTVMVDELWFYCSYFSFSCGVKNLSKLIIEEIFYFCIKQDDLKQHLNSPKSDMLYSSRPPRDIGVGGSSRVTEQETVLEVETLFPNYIELRNSIIDKLNTRSMLPRNGGIKGINAGYVNTTDRNSPLYIAGFHSFTEEEKKFICVLSAKAHPNTFIDSPGLRQAGYRFAVIGPQHKAGQPLLGFPVKNYQNLAVSDMVRSVQNSGKITWVSVTNSKSNLSDIRKLVENTRI